MIRSLQRIVIEASARIDAYPCPEPASGHRVVALLVAHERLGAHGPYDAASELVRVLSRRGRQGLVLQQVARLPRRSSHARARWRRRPATGAPRAFRSSIPVKVRPFQEALPQVLHRALHLALCPRPVRPVARRLEAVVAAKVQEALVRAQFAPTTTCRMLS